MIQIKKIGGEDTDTTTFERLYAECYGSVQRLCYYKLPSKIDGDDIIQEIALTAWSRRESVRSTGAFKAWLLRIATNKCNDFYRKRVTQSELPLEPENSIILHHSRYGLTTTEAVQKTFKQLGERDAQILRLFYTENLLQAEIANLLNIPIGTVKSRLNIAKKRFKNEYPFPPKSKGDFLMSKLPKTLPEYTIKRLNDEPFPVIYHSTTQSRSPLS